MSVLQGSVYVAELVADSDLSTATVTCTVTAPNGTITTPTVTVTGTVATAPVPATLPGVYLIVWVSSGAVVGATQDQFTCVAARADLISLPDLKDELNIRATDTTLDPKLRRWLRAATSVVENITGPILPYPQTDYFDGGTTTVVLMARWVSTVNSVAENWAGTDYLLTEQPVGASVNGFGYTWDRDTNTIIRRTSGGIPVPFQGGLRTVAVSYTGGLLTVPEDLQIAAAELIKHWYRKSQPFRSGPFGADTGEGEFVGNYLVPNSVLELVTPWRRPPGIF